MSDERTDEEIVFEALRVKMIGGDDPSEWHPETMREEANVAVAALRAAGRLSPPGAEARESTDAEDAAYYAETGILSGPLFDDDPPASPSPPVEEGGRRSEGIGVFRKRPVEVEAWQWDGSGVCLAMIEAWSNRIVEYTEDDGVICHTLEGPVTVTEGDWIIRGVEDEFYPCKPSIFDATYEPAPVASTETVTLPRDALRGAEAIEFMLAEGLYAESVRGDCERAAAALRRAALAGEAE